MAFTFTITSLVALASLSGSALAAPTARAECAFNISSKSGDTCATLASTFGLTEADIKNANDFVTCNDIWANTPLCIPPGGNPTCVSTYTSAAGDTCDTIGTKFNTYSAAIKNANNFVTCNDIWTNTPICIPPGGSTTSNNNGNTGGNTGGSNGGSGCVMTYITDSGDTCDSLGNDFGLTGTAIKNSNSFLNCNDIWSGTPICVPPGGRVSLPQAGSASSCVVTYFSAAGENCDSIGQKFGVEEWEISNANSFVNCNDIWAGTPLCIVSGCS